MTLQAIRENLEQARNGLPYLVPDDGFNIILGADGAVKNGEYTTIHPTMHEAKLYSVCEGLIVELERQQQQIDTLLRVFSTHKHTGAAPKGRHGITSEPHQ